MNVLLGLFQWYDLAANVRKSCKMTFQTGILRLGISEEANAMKYWVRLRRRISCPECGVELTAGSMTAHLLHMYGTEPAIKWSHLSVSQTEHQPQMYNARFLQSTKQ